MIIMTKNMYMFEIKQACLFVHVYASGNAKHFVIVLRPGSNGRNIYYGPDQWIYATISIAAIAYTQMLRYFEVDVVCTY